MVNNFRLITKILSFTLLGCISSSCNPPNNYQQTSKEINSSVIPGIKPGQKIINLKEFKIKTSVEDPLPCGDRYYIRIYNTDDTGSAYVNLNQAVIVGYSQDSGFVDVTSLFIAGTNTVNFKVYNGPSGYTWGFTLKKNNEILFDEVAGAAGYYGANDNDQSRQYQIVFDKTIPLNVCEDSNQPYITDTEYFPNGKNVKYNSYKFGVKGVKSCL